jgi:hypothetical protein
MRLGYHELLEAFSEPGCAVCRRAEEAVDDAIAGFLHEHVNDPGFRAELRASHGFCHAHAWRVVRRHDILGTALLYRLLLTQPPPRRRSRCRLCAAHDSGVDAAVDLLTHRQSQRALLQALRASDGLCDEHFERVRSLPGFEDAQRVARERLLADLDELIRKQDYRFAHEPDAGEAQAWKRAVAAVNGLDVQALPRRRSAKLPPRRREP